MLLHYGTGSRSVSIVSPWGTCRILRRLATSPIRFPGSFFFFVLSVFFSSFRTSRWRPTNQPTSYWNSTRSQKKRCEKKKKGGGGAVDPLQFGRTVAVVWFGWRLFFLLWYRPMFQREGLGGREGVVASPHPHPTGEDRERERSAPV